MKRFSIFLTVIIFLSLVISEVSQAKETRPNFIIFIADDVGWNDIGCYGHPHIRTPNVDRMAKEGMRFDLAFLTCSSCSPSRCSIMTGRYPHTTGAGELHQPLPKQQVVFAGLLKKAGYYTASAGKWHLGKSAEVNFDLIVGGRPSGCENWVKVLEERPKDQPFFMWFAGIDAHRPYSKNIIPRPHTAKDIVVPPFLPDVSKTREDLALYYDEVARFDDYVGRVMAELEKQGVADNTMLLFMADNGRPFPRCKTTVYDSGVRTPFVVRWPKKVKAGQTCGNLVSSVDIAPTLLELAGLKSSPTFQGKSFARQLSDPTQTTRKYVYAEHNWHDYQAHERSVRSTRYLYIRNALPHLPGTPPADAVRSMTFVAMQKLHAAGKLNADQLGCFTTPRAAEELYDLVADPHSLHNLAADASYAAVLKELRQAHRAWAERTDDRVPKNPTPDGFDRTTGLRLKK